MSQLFTLYKVAVDEEAHQQEERTGFLTGDRALSSKRFSSSSWQVHRQFSARRLSAVSRSSSGRRPRGSVASSCASQATMSKRLSLRVLREEECEEDSEEETAEEDDEQTGSEHWDSGCHGGGTLVEEEEEEEEEEDLPVASHRRCSMRAQSFLDRLKEKRTSRSNFGFHVNLAFKGAVFTVLGNLPMLVPPLQRKIPHAFWPVLGYVGLYVVFTLWKTIGDTVAFAVQGIVGAFLGTAHVLVVTLLVGSVTPRNNLEFCFVWFEFVLFVGLVLWLNIETNTRNTALCTHVSYFMLVLKPEDPTAKKNLMRSLTLEELRKWPHEVVNLSVVVVGNLLGLVAALLPLVPVLPSTYAYKAGDALRYAEEEVRDLAKQMGQVVMDAVRGFGAVDESLAVDGFIAQAMQMQERLGKLDVLTDAAWWEVMFPFMSHRRVRLRVVKDMRDIMIGVLDNIIILLYTLKYEDFQESHERIMNEIEVPLEELAQFFYDELQQAMDTLAEAHIQGLQPSRKDVLLHKKHLITVLGKAYMRTIAGIARSDEADSTESIRRRSISLRATLRDAGVHEVRKIAVLHETMEESHFVYRLILMVDRLIMRLERQEADPEERTPPCAAVYGLMKHVTSPKVLFEMEHVTFAIRQSITIVVCFIVCMRYYDYSPTMVVTQALLVGESTHTGSMLKKNLGRLQGVVIGTIFPHLFFDWFSQCIFSHELALGIILFLFEWMSLYIYYSSEDFGYVGSLVGGFGASALCQGCGRTVNTLKSLYLTMEQNAVGIGVLTAIDLIFAPERASDMANHLMYCEQGASSNDVGILPSLQHGLVTALNLDILPGDQDAISSQRYAQVVRPECFGEWNMRAIRQFKQAHGLCSEASAEPRYMRRPWPLKLYQDVIKVCQGLRVDIIALTDAVGGPSLKQKDHRDLIFDDVQEFKTFTRKLRKAFNKVSHIVCLALKHFEEESGEQGKRVAEIHQETKSLKIPLDEDISRLSRALVEHPAFRRGMVLDFETRRLSIRSHLLKDMFCRISVAVCVLKNVSRRLQRLHTSVVENL